MAIWVSLAVNHIHWYMDDMNDENIVAGIASEPPMLVDSTSQLSASHDS
jgi:hypothetical protein